MSSIRTGIPYPLGILTTSYPADVDGDFCKRASETHICMQRFRLLEREQIVRLFARRHWRTTLVYVRR